MSDNKVATGHRLAKRKYRDATAQNKISLWRVWVEMDGDEQMVTIMLNTKYAKTIQMSRHRSSKLMLSGTKNSSPTLYSQYWQEVVAFGLFR